MGDEISHAEMKIEEVENLQIVSPEDQDVDEERPHDKKEVKKVIKKKKIIKKKKTVVTGDDGVPKVVEEITEEEVPEIHEITVTDEAETTIEGVVKPIITEMDADEISHAEMKIEKVEDVQIVSPEDQDVDEERPHDKKEGVKKVIKKKKIIKQKKTVVTGDDGVPKVVEEITEEEVPEIHEITVRDEAETTIEGVVKPIITEMDADEISHAEMKIEEVEDVQIVSPEDQDVDEE